MPKEPRIPISPTDLFLWEKDRYLSVLAGQLQDIRLLSLDIFDTLLFRTCANPSDVFSTMAMQAHHNGSLKTHVSPEAFKEMRIRAEHKARAKSNRSNGLR